MQRGGGYVFKFGGNGITGIKQALPAVGVAVGCLNLAVAGLACGAGRGGVEYDSAVAHALGGVYQHTRQLPAAKYAQCAGAGIGGGA